MQLYVFSRSCEIQGTIEKMLRTKLKTNNAFTENEIIHISTETHSATASISARAVRAFVDLNLTAVPSEARST